MFHLCLEDPKSQCRETAAISMLLWGLRHRGQWVPGPCQPCLLHRVLGQLCNPCQKQSILQTLLSFNLPNGVSDLVWKLTTVIPELDRGRQGDEEFRPSLSYLGSSKEAHVGYRRPCPKTKQNPNEENQPNKISSQLHLLRNPVWGHPRSSSR